MIIEVKNTRDNSTWMCNVDEDLGVTIGQLVVYEKHCNSPASNWHVGAVTSLNPFCKEALGAVICVVQTEGYHKLVNQVEALKISPTSDFYLELLADRINSLTKGWVKYHKKLLAQDLANNTDNYNGYRLVNGMMSEINDAFTAGIIEAALEEEKSKCQK